MIFMGTSSGGPSKLVNMLTFNNTGTFRSVNNTYNVGQYSTYGIYKSNNSSNLISFSDLYNVDGTGAQTFGIKFDCAWCGTPNLVRPTFGLMSHATGSFARGIGAYNSTLALTINEASMDPSNRDGSLITTDFANSSYSATITIDNSELHFAGTNNNLNRFPFYFSYVNNITFNNSYVSSSMPSQTTIKALGQSASGQFSLNTNNSRFATLSNLSFAFINSSTFAQNITTNNTHFIRAVTAGASSPTFNVTTAPLWNTTSTSSPKDTYFCGPDGSTNWSGISSTGPSGSITTGGAPTPTSTLDISDMLCQ